jgi:hypothetical protein
MRLVSASPDPLPDEIEALRALVRRCPGRARRRRAEPDRAVEQNGKLRHLLQQLRRARVGLSSDWP